MAHKIFRMLRSRDSSVGIATSYGVRFPAEARNISLLHIAQTKSAVHPAPYLVDTGGSFPGVKEAES
jgi:hypothetical protein